MKLELQPLQAAHADVLSALHGDSTEIPWSPESFASLLLHRHRFGWLAEADSEPAGYILVQAIAGESEILSLAVRPSRQGNGIGRQLVARALEEVKSLGVERLLLKLQQRMPGRLRSMRASDFNELAIGVRIISAVAAWRTPS